MEIKSNTIKLSGDNNQPSKVDARNKHIPESTPDLSNTAEISSRKTVKHKKPFSKIENYQKLIPKEYRDIIEKINLINKNYKKSRQISFIIEEFKSPNAYHNPISYVSSNLGTTIEKSKKDTFLFEYSNQLLKDANYKFLTFKNYHEAIQNKLYTLQEKHTSNLSYSKEIATIKNDIQEIEAILKKISENLQKDELYDKQIEDIFDQDPGLEKPESSTNYERILELRSQLRISQLSEEVKQKIENLCDTTLHNLSIQIKNSINDQFNTDFLTFYINFLNDNKSSFSTLFDNFYTILDTGPSRYKDNLKHAWLDLMPIDYYFGNNPEKFEDPSLQKYKDEFKVLHDLPLYKSLKRTIAKYQNTNKTDENLITNRIDLLKQIAASAATCLQTVGEKDKTILQEIIARANIKADYLSKIETIQTEIDNRSGKLSKRHGTYNDNLVNVKSDFIKDIDPEKRFGLHELCMQWMNETGEKKLSKKFFIWLEGIDTSRLQKDLRHTFISRGLKEVHFKNGIAYNEIFRGFGNNDTKGQVLDGQYVYNISEDGQLYIAPAFQTLDTFRSNSKVLFNDMNKANSTPYELNHDTLLGGDNVRCAGIVKFKGGKMEHIDTNSGHYKPSMSNLQYALAVFTAKTPNAISDNTNISDYEGRINIPYSLFKNQPIHP